MLACGHVLLRAAEPVVCRGADASQPTAARMVARASVVRAVQHGVADTGAAHGDQARPRVLLHQVSGCSRRSRHNTLCAHGKGPQGCHQASTWQIDKHHSPYLVSSNTLLCNTEYLVSSNTVNLLYSNYLLIDISPIL